MIGVLINRRNLDTCTQGECHVNVKADVEVMCLQAKGHQRLAANHLKLAERHGIDSPSRLLRRSQPCQHFDLGLLGSRTVRE